MIMRRKVPMMARIFVKEDSDVESFSAGIVVVVVVVLFVDMEKRKLNVQTKICKKMTKDKNKLNKFESKKNLCSSSTEIDDDSKK